MLGLRRHPFSLPYRFFGGHTDLSSLEIDLTKHFYGQKIPNQLPQEFLEKYALLDYAVKYWADHSQLPPKNPAMLEKLQNLVLRKILPFEHRPWGPNSHFGPFGCRACPLHSDPRDTNDLTPDKLPYSSLLHWAAENGKLFLIRMVDKKPHGYHERYNNETLFRACRNGHTEIVGHLLVKMAPYIDLTNGIAIEIATSAGNQSIFQALLYHGLVYPRQYDVVRDGHRPLGIASSIGHLAIVKRLLQCGADGNIPDNTTGKTSLHLAAGNGHVNIVRELVSDPGSVGRSNLIGKEAQDDELNSYGEGTRMATRKLQSGYDTDNDVDSGSKASAISVDQEFRVEETRTTSLRVNLDVQLPNLITGETALHYASGNGHEAVSLALLQEGASFDHEDHDGETPLIKAAKNGHWRVIDLLLVAGANRWHTCRNSLRLPNPEILGLNVHPSRINDKGERLSAVYFAAAHGHVESVALLCQRPALWPFDLSFDLLFDLAAAFGRSDVIKLLLDKAIHTCAPINLGYSALHTAAYYEHPRVISALLGHPTGIFRISIDTKDSLGLTAAMYAACIGSVEILEILQAYGANLLSSSDDRYQGMQPIHFATVNKKVQAVRFLLDCGVDVNSETHKSQRPIQYAARSGSETLVQMLLDSGASYSPTSNTYPPIQFAALHGHKGCLEILLHDCLYNRPWMFDSELQAAIKRLRLNGKGTADLKQYRRKAADVVKSLLGN